MCTTYHGFLYWVRLGLELPFIAAASMVLCSALVATAELTTPQHFSCCLSPASRQGAGQGHSQDSWPKLSIPYPLPYNIMQHQQWGGGLGWRCASVYLWKWWMTAPLGWFWFLFHLFPSLIKLFISQPISFLTLALPAFFLILLVEGHDQEAQMITSVNMPQLYTHNTNHIWGLGWWNDL